jgi:O-antigen/teichoic acid export membrane protein
MESNKEIKKNLSFFWLRLLPKFLQRKIKSQDKLHKVINNIGWLFFDKLLRMGMGLVVGAWVARYLGPEQFGLLNFAIAFSALFSAIATLGLDGIVVRDIVRYPSSAKKILGTAFYLKLIGGFIMLFVTVIAISILQSDNSLCIWLVAITAMGSIFQAFDVIDFWFQSQVQSKYVVYAKNAAFLIMTIIKIILILLSAPLIAFAWAGLAEIAIGSIGLIIFYQLKGHRFSALKSRFAHAKRLLRDSWPLVFSGIVIMIYMRIDQIMIGQMVGVKEVGIYAVAVRIAEVWYFIPTAVVASVFPSIVEAKLVSEELFYARLQKLYDIMALMGYIVAIPVTFLSRYIVVFLFGTPYQAAGPMLALLIWAGLFTNLGVARSSFLTTMNWTRVHFFTVFLGCLINVILNYILIPIYGGMGAVIASCISYWFAAHGACFFYKPLFKTGYMITKAMAYPKVW